MTITPAPGRKSNTYYATVGGCMTGVINGTSTITPRKVDIMFVSDKTGESLSINAGDTGFTVPYEAVEALAEYVRSKRKR